MSKKILPMVLCFAFFMSGCTATDMIKERIDNKTDGKLNEIIGGLLKKDDNESEDIRESLEGTWIRSDSAAIYGAKMEISFDEKGGKGVLRTVPKNTYGFAEGDIKWKDIEPVDSTRFVFDDLAEIEGSSKYVSAEAVFDADDMTISVTISDENVTAPYQLWVKSGYMDIVEMSPEQQEEQEPDFLFNGDKELITEAELDKHTKEEVAIIRNEIYARHGYIFKTEPFISYFAAKSWYTPNENFNESMLNETERQNREFIVAYEEKRGWR